MIIDFPTKSPIENINQTPTKKDLPNPTQNLKLWSWFTCPT